MSKYTRSIIILTIFLLLSSSSFAYEDLIELNKSHPFLIKSTNQVHENRLLTQDINLDENCNDLSALPFVTTDLSLGVGDFGMDALSEFWTVDCPVGINPCPGVLFPNIYQALQAGTYGVNYTKTISGGGTDQCEYQLFVGAQGLQVELEWEWNFNDFGGSSSVDLDLHIHEPNSILPWGGNQGNESNCAWDNCTASSFSFPTGGEPDWFIGTNPPEPVDWYLSNVFEENVCYFAPKGIGTQWQILGMGCHNPRLDIDNITCDYTVTDPQNFNYCNPEISNIDYPPNDQWTRIGVHYYGNHGQSYDVTPKINITCRGQSPISLGPTGYDQAVTFSANEGSDLFWIVADVLFHRDEDPEQTYCIVKPIFADEKTQTPLLQTVNQVQSSVGPDYQVVAEAEVIINSNLPVYDQGSAVQYSLIVRNNGPDDLSAAQIIVFFPSILENISWVCEGDTGVICIPSGGPSLSQIVVIPSDTEARFTIDAEIPENAIEQSVIVDVELTLHGDILDLNPSNNSKTSTVSIGIFGNGFEDF